MTSNLKKLIPKLSPIPALDISALGSGGQFLEIVASSRLWLEQFGCGDDERFAANFRETWRRIPFGHRRRMVKYWRESNPCPPLLLVSPTIELVRYWGNDHWDRQPKDLGACWHRGHRLSFYAPIVDAMPACHVQELIAHELAHVFQWAIGNEPNTEKDLETGEDVPRFLDIWEVEADEIMEFWGFDSSAIDGWANDNWTWESSAG